MQNKLKIFINNECKFFPFIDGPLAARFLYINLLSGKKLEQIVKNWITEGKVDDLQFFFSRGEIYASETVEDIMDGIINWCPK